MRRFYFNGTNLYDLGESRGSDILTFVREGAYNIGYVIGFTYAIAIRFAAGFFGVLLLKALWHAIFG